MKRSLKMSILILVVCASIPSVLSAQVDTVWVRRYNGQGNGPDRANALAIDGLGNVYVTGRSLGSGTFYDYATIKYDAAGIEQWVARYNGPGNADDEAYDLAIDNQGNVFVTGCSHGSGTSLDFATVKYDPSGVEQWVARYNGSGNDTDYARCIAVDGQGNVCVAGVSCDSSANDVFMTIKYNSSGYEQWKATYFSCPSIYDSYFNGAQALAIDAQGNIHVAGESNGHPTTIKYFPNGDTVWAREYVGGEFWGGRADCLAIDDSANVYIAGSFSHGYSHHDFLMIKYDPDGDTVWTNAQCHTYSNILLREGNNIAVDNSQNISVINSDYLVKFYPNGDTAWQRYNDFFFMNALAMDDAGAAYVTGGISGSYGRTMKYNSTGEQQWTGDYFNLGSFESVVVDDNGCVYVTGGSYTPISSSYDYVTIKYAQTTAITGEKIFHDEHTFPTTTIFSGPLQLPVGRTCRVFDIAGRVVEPSKIQPGIYFVEIDGEVVQKVIKIR